jgi:hypothetical protein
LMSVPVDVILDSSDSSRARWSCSRCRSPASRPSHPRRSAVTGPATRRGLVRPRGPRAARPA